MVERALLFVKPDGVQRGIVGEVISRFERRGLKLMALKLMTLTEKMVDQHYHEHIKKPFYPSLKSYILSGPVVAFVLEGEDAIRVIRKTVGATNPADAEPGTIRGDFALTTAFNIIHASDSVESAKKEVALFFSEI